jgi:hypothetical protein
MLAPCGGREARLERREEISIPPLKADGCASRLEVAKLDRNRLVARNRQGGLVERNPEAVLVSIAAWLFVIKAADSPEWLSVFRLPLVVCSDG